mmetsp:Transcript_48501/g.115464  ORF Transcript_48501/g.115464 Transcript_48501/m.115464 type:complete len:266 (-) Transcript_48501:17-814(-)
MKLIMVMNFLSFEMSYTSRFVSFRLNHPFPTSLRPFRSEFLSEVSHVSLRYTAVWTMAWDSICSNSSGFVVFVGCGANSDIPMIRWFSALVLTMHEISSPLVKNELKLKRQYCCAQSCGGTSATTPLSRSRTESASLGGATMPFIISLSRAASSSLSKTMRFMVREYSKLSSSMIPVVSMLFWRTSLVFSARVITRFSCSGASIGTPSTGMLSMYRLYMRPWSVESRACRARETRFAKTKGSSPRNITASRGSVSVSWVSAHLSV